jgi:hypothetical protein
MLVDAKPPKLHSIARITVHPPRSIRWRRGGCGELLWRRPVRSVSDAQIGMSRQDHTAQCGRNKICIKLIFHISFPLLVQQETLRLCRRTPEV